MGNGGGSGAGDDRVALGSHTTPARCQLLREGEGCHLCPQRLGTQQGHRRRGAGSPGGRLGGGRAVQGWPSQRGLQGTGSDWTLPSALTL